ncbi:unnamed protein product [Sphenostylis stenocarpa]|uniref:Uncharacterized protein n=1 Tax=Sphenostylis stenocarpa TaxID=92480 RepID=A0AA86W416_9FABA|nr:unnamed protein product [Sphenostylis stenocarpa]
MHDGTVEMLQEVLTRDVTKEKKHGILFGQHSPPKKDTVTSLSFLSVIHVMLPLAFQ